MIRSSFMKVIPVVAGLSATTLLAQSAPQKTEVKEKKIEKPAAVEEVEKSEVSAAPKIEEKKAEEEVLAKKPAENGTIVRVTVDHDFTSNVRKLYFSRAYAAGTSSEKMFDSEDRTGFNSIGLLIGSASGPMQYTYGVSAILPTRLGGSDSIGDSRFLSIAISKQVFEMYRFRLFNAGYRFSILPGLDLVPSAGLNLIYGTNTVTFTGIALDQHTIDGPKAIYHKGALGLEAGVTMIASITERLHATMQLGVEHAQKIQAGLETKEGTFSINGAGKEEIEQNLDFKTTPGLSLGLGLGMYL